MRMAMEIIFLYLAIALIYVSSSMPNNISSCPIDLTYVERIPWNTSVCATSLQKSIPTATNDTHCCQALLSLFGIGLAEHLKKTSQFQLPDLPTAAACVQDFQTKLNTFSLPPDIVSTCFGNPDRFRISPQVCAGIQTKQDWIDKMGLTTQLDSSCQYDLSDTASCEACVKASLKVQARLTAIDGNASHSTDCYYFIILYAGGVINEYGPESISNAVCIFALPVSSVSSSNGNTNNGANFPLISVGISVIVAILVNGLRFSVNFV